jgi:hypothetical protein
VVIWEEEEEPGPPWPWKSTLIPTPGACPCPRPGPGPTGREGSGVAQGAAGGAGPKKSSASLLLEKPLNTAPGKPEVFC